MVERGVEDCALLLRATLHAYASEGLVPLCLGCLAHAVEVARADFGIEVAACVLHRYIRYTDLDNDLCAWGEVAELEDSTYVVTHNLSRVIFV